MGHHGSNCTVTVKDLGTSVLPVLYCTEAGMVRCDGRNCTVPVTGMERSVDVWVPVI